jgi:hypothetical protein
LKDVGDIDGMAEKAISTYLKTKKGCNSLKNNALARAKQFDLATILPVYENYYVEVIERCKEKV